MLKENNYYLARHVPPTISKNVMFYAALSSFLASKQDENRKLTFSISSAAIKTEVETFVRSYTINWGKRF